MVSAIFCQGSNPRRVTKSEQAAYRLLRLFYKKSECAHSAAPPLQPRSASLGSRLVLGADLKASTSKVITLSTSSRTAYRSRRLFYKKSSLTHSVAPPFRIEPASLGFDSVLGADPKACTSKVIMLSSSEKAQRAFSILSLYHFRNKVPFCGSLIPKLCPFAHGRRTMDRSICSG